MPFCDVPKETDAPLSKYRIKMKVFAEWMAHVWNEKDLNTSVNDGI